MNWQVEFTDIAIHTLKKLDKHTAAMIIGCIEKKLVGDVQPTAFGKPLILNDTVKWIYRIGDFRLLCQVKDTRVMIVALQLGNRKSVYKQSRLQDSCK